MINNTLDELTILITAWAGDKGILIDSSPRDQYLKVAEECGEIAAALARRDSSALRDAIGDTYVTLVILARLSGTNIFDCVSDAYETISGRTGEMQDGIFIRQN